MIEELVNKVKKNDIVIRIVRALFFGITGAAGAKILLMIINILIARLISNQDYGVYSLLNNTVQTFVLFAGAGIGITLTRYTAIYQNKDKNKAGYMIKTLSVVNIVLSAIVSITILVFSDYISQLLSKEINISIYIKIISITIFFSSLALLCQSVLQGFEEFKRLAKIQITCHIMALIISVIITMLWKLNGAVISMLLLQLLLFIFSINTTKRICKDKKIELKTRFDREIKYAIKNVSIPAFLSSIFVNPVIWITNFLFIKKFGYEEFAGFSICLQWMYIVNYIPQQLNQVKPIYTQLYDSGQVNTMKKTVNKLTIFSILLVIVVVSILSILKDFILRLYGEFYLAFGTTFITLLITNIFIVIQSQNFSVFQAIGEFWKCLILNGIWAGAFLISFILLYGKGSLGYATAYLISYIIYSIISCTELNRTLKKHSKEESK